jgi:hypothetical protein
VGQHIDQLGPFENFRAPWESETGEDESPNPEKLKKYLYNLLLDKATAQDARDETAEKVTEAENKLKTAKAEVAKGDPTGKIAELEGKLAEAETNAKKAQTSLDKLTVGIEKGLTPKQAARLQGETKEELEADADEILETFGVAKPAENEEEEEEDEDDEVELRTSPRLLQNPADPKREANDGDYDYDKVVSNFRQSVI